MEIFQFDEASNGLEAIEMVKKKIYKLILMDRQMPEMDGFTTTKYLRGHGFKDFIVGITGDC